MWHILHIDSVATLTLGIPRASNVSHTVVLRPLKAGYFNFTSATVSYLAQEGGQVVVSSMYLRLFCGTGPTSLWDYLDGDHLTSTHQGITRGLGKPPGRSIMCSNSVMGIVSQP